MPTGDAYEAYKFHQESERKRREAEAELAVGAGNDVPTASKGEPADVMDAVLSEVPVFDASEPGVDGESWRHSSRRSQSSADHQEPEHGEPEPAANGNESTP